MNHYAILCGSAPGGFTQKKINEMYDFLTSSSGGAWAEKEIVFFPNGVDDAMLAFVRERLKADKTEQIFLFCALICLKAFNGSFLESSVFGRL